MKEGTRRAHGFLGVLEELFGTVWNAIVLLGLGTSSVDSRGGFGGVAPHKSGVIVKYAVLRTTEPRNIPLLIEQENIASTLEDSMSSRKTSEAASNDDDRHGCRIR